jgi:hypothetical protein
MPDGMRSMAPAKLIGSLLLFVACSATVVRCQSGSETAQSADDFVNSVGVNVHLMLWRTVYGDFPAVEKALQNLGVRHIRDGLVDTTWAPYYDRLNELGKLGIKSTLITSPSETSQLIADYPSRVPDSFEAYEAPNEYDQSRDPDWAATLNAFLARLHSVVESDPSTSRFPIIGPSLTRAESFPQVAESGAFFDYSNLHNYLGGREPGTAGWGRNGYGSISWNLALVQHPWPNKPVMTTETGYLNDLSNVQGIPEDVSGKYLPRLLLEQWMRGIHRTYLYQLLDHEKSERDPGSSYGLLHSDFTPKIGYRAIQGLLQLLSDPGPAFKLDDLNLDLSGNLAHVHHVLFERRDATFYLALWVEEPSYDVNTKTYLHVPAQQITVRTGQTMKMEEHELDDEGFMHKTNLGTTETQVVSIGDRVTVLEMSR